MGTTIKANVATNRGTTEYRKKMYHNTLTNRSEGQPIMIQIPVDNAKTLNKKTPNQNVEDSSTINLYLDEAHSQTLNLQKKANNCSQTQ